MKIGKYMTAKAVGMTPREVYTIHTSGGVIGTCEWFPRWRTYVFEPEFGGVFSDDCLQAMSEFLSSLGSAKADLRGFDPPGREHTVGDAIGLRRIHDDLDEIVGDWCARCQMAPCVCCASDTEKGK